MKRSPLKRKTPLKPGNTPLKRTRLAPISKQKRKENASNASFLDAYRAAHPLCQCSEDCGREATEIHEIAGGSHRQKCRRLASCVLHVAHECHARMQSEPYARGLARKLETGPEDFDLAEFVRTIGRAPKAITIEEVLVHMPEQKTASEYRQLVEHFQRKITVLENNLAKARAEGRAADREYLKAMERERAMKETR